MRIAGTNSPVFPEGWIRELGSHAPGAEVRRRVWGGCGIEHFRADVPDRVLGRQVTVNVLDVLGVQPASGKIFFCSRCGRGRGSRCCA